MTLGAGQISDVDHYDDREEELTQVDGPMDVHTPPNKSDNNKSGEQGNNASKRPWKQYAPPDLTRKQLTKQRQAKVLKQREEKEKGKAKGQMNNNNNIPDITNQPRPQRSKDKASHPDQNKSSEKGRKRARKDNENDVPDDIQTFDDNDILLGDQVMVPDNRDEIGSYTFFLEGQGNPSDLLGTEDDQLRAIQNDLRERLQARDEARERAVTC